MDKEDPAFDRECMSIEFWSPSRQLINFLGWRAATTRWANNTAWQHMAAYLGTTSQAISTQSLLRADRARNHLGAVLQNKERTLEERAIRRMLQARGFNTPVQAVLSRNSGGRVSAVCPFCHQDRETLGHFSMACEQFCDMRTAAHDTVADATVEAIHQQMRAEKASTTPPRPDHLQVWINTTMETAFPQLWGTWEGKFKPDGLVIDPDDLTVYVLELTRGMESSEQRWRDKTEEKIAAYHSTTLFLQAQYPHYTVVQANFVVGVLGSVMEAEWRRTLTGLGLGEQATDKVLRAAIEAAVRAFDATLSVRQAAREALGGVEAGFSPHPSQLS